VEHLFISTRYSLSGYWRGRGGRGHEGKRLGIPQGASFDNLGFRNRSSYNNVIAGRYHRIRGKVVRIMPIHFKTIQEFRDLITKHSVAEVIVSQTDFNFLWERVEPIKRFTKKWTITILNNRKEIVIVTTKLKGILDLTGDNILFVEKEP